MKVEIKYIGITSHSLETIEKSIEDEKFSTIQFPYNIIEDQADEVFKKANKKDIGIIVMKPLAGGAIDDAKLAIKYILSKDYIDVVIPGMESIEQIEFLKQYQTLGKKDGETYDKTSITTFSII